MSFVPAAAYTPRPLTPEEEAALVAAGSQAPAAPVQNLGQAYQAAPPPATSGQAIGEVATTAPQAYGEQALATPVPVEPAPAYGGYQPGQVSEGYGGDPAAQQYQNPAPTIGGVQTNQPYAGQYQPYAPSSGERANDIMTLPSPAAQAAANKRYATGTNDLGWDQVSQALARGLGYDPKNPDLDVAGQISQDVYRDLGNTLGGAMLDMPLIADDASAILRHVVKGAGNLAEPLLKTDATNELADEWAMAEDTVGMHGMLGRQIASTPVTDPYGGPLAAGSALFSGAGKTMADIDMMFSNGLEGFMNTPLPAVLPGEEPPVPDWWPTKNVKQAGYETGKRLREGESPSEIIADAAIHTPTIVLPEKLEQYRARTIGEEIADQVGPNVPDLSLPAGNGRAPYTQAESLRVFGQNDAGSTPYGVLPPPPPADQVNTGPILAPPPTNAVRGSAMPAPPPTSQVNSGRLPAPPPTDRVTSAPMPAPPPSRGVRGGPIPAPPPTNAVRGGAIPAPPPSNQVNSAAMPAPPPTNRVASAPMPATLAADRVNSASMPAPPPANQVNSGYLPAPPPADVVRGGAMPAPPPTDAVRGTGMPAPPPPNAVRGGAMPAPPPANRVKSGPMPVPPPADRVASGSMPGLPPTTAVRGGPMPAPPPPNSVRGGRIPAPPPSDRVAPNRNAALPAPPPTDLDTRIRTDWQPHYAPESSAYQPRAVVEPEPAGPSWQDRLREKLPDADIPGVTLGPPKADIPGITLPGQGASAQNPPRAGTDAARSPTALGTTGAPTVDVPIKDGRGAGVGTPTRDFAANWGLPDYLAGVPAEVAARLSGAASATPDVGMPTRDFAEGWGIPDRFADIPRAAGAAVSGAGARKDAVLASGADIIAALSNNAGVPGVGGFRTDPAPGGGYGVPGDVRIAAARIRGEGLSPTHVPQIGSDVIVIKDASGAVVGVEGTNTGQRIPLNMETDDQATFNAAVDAVRGGPAGAGGASPITPTSPQVAQSVPIATPIATTTSDQSTTTSSSQRSSGSTNTGGASGGHQGGGGSTPRSSSGGRSSDMGSMFADDDEDGLNESDFMSRDWDNDGKVTSKDRSIGRKKFLAAKKKRKGKRTTSTSNVPARTDSAMRTQILDTINKSMSKSKKR